ncbi:MULTISPECIES: aldo/keto reductase [Streptomyces]|uniref:aldo/keto reductase n=1 Tax=Streptomyces TaxID=1883 RepID=UPI001F310E2F|nr:MULTISPECIES: aldo/keto reductase [Streptomyces]
MRRTSSWVRWQVRRSREQLGRERLDLVLLHSPERAHPGDRLALHQAMRDAFMVLEEEVAVGNVAGYGVATWAGLEEEAFTMGELLALAAEAAGGQLHHLVAVQLPVSLVMMTPHPGPGRPRSAPGRRGRGPAGDGLSSAARRRAPRHGRPGARRPHPAGPYPRTGVLLTVASCPGVTDVLIAASSTPHWRDAADAVAQPSLTAAKLREITHVLASP